MSDVLELDRKLLRAATVGSLAKIEGVTGVDDFVDKIEGTSVPAPISATASVTFFAIYGVLKCEPRGQSYKFDSDFWGAGATAVSSVGLMYTAYETWEAFFKNTTAFHVQGIASGGGILQVNWFNKSAVPIGQFNGAAGGLGVLEAGGAGKWKHT